MDNPLDKVLSDIEKAELTKFANNPVLVNAFKKVLLFGVYYNGILKPDEAPDPTRNFALSNVFTEVGNAMSNEKIGENLRAKAEGVLLIQGGFDQIESYKTEAKTDKKKENGAR